ncbi:MAG: tryptophan synthase subunit beta [Rhodobacteraceae bacterium]|nr:tryptophan synthase subunit beta [Paracoccaceae bacterium]
MSREARKHENRLHRQFEAINRLAPAARGPLNAILRGRFRVIRLPLAILLMLGGIFSFLPVLGLWMLPVGLLLLAVDIPRLRPRVSAALIRLRRWWAVRKHKKARRPAAAE